MPQYLFVLDQDGGGCDYTIGCGITYKIFEADDFADAQRQARDIWMGEDFLEGDRDSPQYWWADCHTRKAYLTLLLEECPTEEWVKKAVVIQGRQELQEKEVKERAELARLQEKYGKE